MKLITSADEVLNNIHALQTELAQSDGLVDRLGYVHAWYVDTGNPELPLFGFSKFIGYKGLTAEKYLRKYKALDGRNTEWALKDYFDEIRPDSPDFRRYRHQLSDWLSGFGRAPRKTIRIMLLKPEYREADATEDRRLLELLMAVSDMLTPAQRQELRSHL
ncbi:hypothetical protein GCM10023219_22480 [Stakelama sediminis]|uniref:Uncharacterized protein n=1 Tax=Stakelama sediminis TaxID=463200 RepID=A0A840YZY0_9SPHN|nr:hypothetical protein [Stakelama sediminis]MBB5719203.1 hypothetical protein [Stakelama sediminis]